MNKEHLLNFLGVVCLVVAINQFFVVLFLAKNPVYLLWFSDHVMFLLALGILFRKKILVTAELCIALIPETVWTVDFLSKILFGKYIFTVSGVARYLFADGRLVAQWQNLSSMQHLLILPLGLTALWILKADKNGWKLATAHGLLIWFASFLFGQEYNLNCAFKPCILAVKNMPYYQFLWPLVGLAFIIISNIFIGKIFAIKEKNEACSKERV